MDAKEYKKMTNAELEETKRQCEFSFMTNKKQIDALCEEIVKLEEEYNKADEELKIRQKQVYSA